MKLFSLTRALLVKISLNKSVTNARRNNGGIVVFSGVLS